MGVVTKRRVRFVAVLLLVAVLAPVAPAVVDGGAADRAEADNATAGPSNGRAGDVTLITTQGGFVGQGAGVYAVDTDTKEVIWSHTAFPEKYYDVDPLGNDTVLFVANVGGEQFRAVVANWRTDTILRSFPVPKDTHDVDALGDGRYLIADKSRADTSPDDGPEQKVYVRNVTANETTWAFRFSRVFDANANHTHVNDVDAVDGGAAVLVSARDFDQVLLLDRETETVRWRLGSDGDHDTLFEQHNPVVLSLSPPTVLVADSENDRVVEYRRSDGEWERGWTYAAGLSWPRDADRLPNGNTLVVDSNNDRVIEVTPDGEVVWAYETGRHPYDVERVGYGDEPAGPSLTGEPNATAAADGGDDDGVFASTYDRLYGLASWVLPAAVDRRAFAFLLAAVAVGLVWGGTELSWWRHERP